MRQGVLGSSQKQRPAIWVALTALLLLIGLSSAQAQLTGAGSIQGTVTDAKGAVVPGASVHIVKHSTNQAWDTKTNSVGFYSVPSLFVGDYSVSISATGMATWEGALTLMAGQTGTLDASLRVAGVSAEVTVVGDITPVINEENSTRDTTLSRQTIEQVPQNGRSIAGLLSSTVPGYQGGSGNQPRVNGLVWGAFSWSQDGAPMDYRDGGGLDNVPPDPDTVQEVRVETSNSTALSDRPAYAIFSTKSGTNSLHGSAFETNRDNSYGIAHNRQDSISAKPPKYVRNEYGISAGGPIYIPLLGKGKTLYDGRDKSFFFASWEAMSLRQQAYNYYYVPTDAMRNGDFSQAYASNGTLYTIYDPATTTAGSLSGSTITGWTRTAFPGNVIPANRISPLAQTLFKIANHPTNSGNPYSASTGNWQGPQAVYQQQYDYTMRFDHHFSEVNTVFFRYSLGHRLQYNLGSSAFGPQTTDGVWNGQFQPLDSQSGVLSYTHISTPTFYQTLTASMDYQSWKQQGSQGSSATQDMSAMLGIQNAFGVMGLPNIQGTNGSNNPNQSGILQGYGQGSNAWRDSDYTNTFGDALTWIHGRHQIQFGAEYRHDQLRILPDQAKPAVVSFGGLGTGLINSASGSNLSAQPYTGLALADFFMGNAQSYQNSLAAHYMYLRGQETSVYLQDDFHLRPNLTLNLGVRYEALPAIHEKSNQFVSFDFKNRAIVTGHNITRMVVDGQTTTAYVNALQALGMKFETPDVAGMPAGVFKSYWYNFLPRLGVAYEPIRGLVIRGGFGMYAYPAPMRNEYSGMNGGIPFTTSYSQDWSNAFYASDGLPNWLLRNQQPVIAGKNSTNVISTNVQSSLVPGNSTGISVLSPDQKPEGYREWNFTIEKALKNHTAISAAYQGNHGYNLQEWWYTNNKPSDYVWFMTTGQPKPSGTYANTLTRPWDQMVYGTIQNERKTGWSNANTLQLQFQRHFNKGYSYNVSYVFGKYFRNGGNTWRDSTVFEAANYMPGTVPTKDRALAKFQGYLQDTAMPRQQIKYDWVVEVPVGKGKWLLRNSNRLVDGILGGWQIAGVGNWRQTIWQPSTSDYGPFSKLHYYGKSKPILDCTRGANNCLKAYYAYNGYVTQAQYNNPNGSGYQGLPGTWATMQAGGFQHQPYNLGQNNQNIGPDTNNLTGHPVQITLSNGSTVNNVGYAPGPAEPSGAIPLSPNFRQYLPNPWNFSTDASLFKQFQITERIGLKINGDFFNVFNQQGTTGVSGGTGIIGTTSSANTARIVQVSGRIVF